MWLSDFLYVILWILEVRPKDGIEKDHAVNYLFDYFSVNYLFDYFSGSNNSYQTWYDRWRCI
jgi:hypothetical protein